MKVLAWPAFESPTGNPYTRLLYEAMDDHHVMVEGFTVRRALRSTYDLWHLHWPDDFLSYPSAGKAVFYVVAELLLIFLARQRGSRIVWTIHDLGPHESPHPWLEALFWPFFLPQVDGFITLSEHAREQALRKFPRLHDIPGAVVAHGHYRDAYPGSVSKDEARTEWDLPTDAPVAAFVGRIRPYKNVGDLVTTFRALERSRARLLVTGNPVDERLAEEIRSAAAGSERIHLSLQFIPEERMPAVLGAADLVVLPYEDIMHSGSAMLALSFHRPVLVPARGAMAELRQDVGPEWVYTYEPPLTPQALENALEEATESARPDRLPLENRSWEVLADQTTDLYERVIAAPRDDERKDARSVQVNSSRP